MKTLANNDDEQTLELSSVPPKKLQVFYLQSKNTQIDFFYQKQTTKNIFLI